VLDRCVRCTTVQDGDTYIWHGRAGALSSNCKVTRAVHGT
jgi:hypothetical protein